MEAQEETPVVIGTAGHVDHGKSSLVLAMTGTDPDRLPQEKARGITFDLGFAELDLPSGRAVGLVDVPGHGHYVRQMVAGATGVDIALLVVASDDGVMPQTREHVRILQLLGVRSMVVAVTKCDLVDAEMAELAQADIEDFLSGTVFAGAPSVLVSSRTGQGVGELMALLDQAVDGFLASGAPQRRLARPARLPIDRSFSVAGVGTVVTGTAYAGTFAPGDTVELVPGGVRAKIRSVQVHEADVARAQAGQRTAIGLPGVTLAQAARGVTVCTPGSLAPTDRFDARVTWLGREGAERALESGERVHVCAGTTQVLGRVLLFDGLSALEPGGEARCQIRLEEPLALRSHDRVVLMSYSPVELVGGGEVLWARPARRTNLRPGESRLLDAIEAGDDGAAVLALAALSPLPVTAEEVAGSLDLSAQAVAAELEEACAGGEDGLVRLAGEAGAGAQVARYLGSAHMDALVDALVAELGRAARSNPAFEGLPALTLRDAACPRLGDEAFAQLTGEAVARGTLARFGSNLVLADQLAQVTARFEGLERHVEALLDKYGLAVPFTDELATLEGVGSADLLRGLRGLAAKGRAEEVGRTYYLGAAAADQARQAVKAAIEGAGGSATASALREALGLSRKYAMPLLEHLDQVGFTRRDPADPNLRRLV